MKTIYHFYHPKSETLIRVNDVDSEALAWKRFRSMMEKLEWDPELGVLKAITQSAI